MHTSSVDKAILAKRVSCYTFCMEKPKEKQNYPEHLVIKPTPPLHLIHLNPWAWLIIGGVAVFVGAAGVQWYGRQVRERAVVDTLGRIEQEKVQKESFVSGRVKQIAKDALILVVGDLGGREIRALTPPGTKFYIWGRGNVSKKIQIGRSEIVRNSFVTIKTNEPIGQRNEINAAEVFRIY